MTLNDLVLIFNSLKDAIRRGEDRQLSTDERIEILSAASALVSEATVIAQESHLLNPEDDWILNALSLSADDKLFNLSFEALCRLNHNKFEKLYQISCLFLYRGLLRDNVKQGSIDHLKSSLVSTTTAERADQLIAKLKKNGFGAGR
ncbi:MAG: hypothetical protein ACK47C_21850 [Paracoccaceae bacterium]|jgi:hypothetical protein